MGCSKERGYLPFRTWVAVETYRRLPSHLTMIAVHVGRYLHASRMQDCHCLKQHLVKHFIWFFPKGSGTLNGMVHAASVMAGDLLFPFFPAGAAPAGITVFWLDIAQESVCTVLES